MLSQRVSPRFRVVSMVCWLRDLGQFSYAGLDCDECSTPSRLSLLEFALYVFWKTVEERP